MASSIVVEDGTGVAGANAYVNAADARMYAQLRGVALPVAPADGLDPVEVFLILATDYLEAQSYIGRPAFPSQSLAWPRVLFGRAWYEQVTEILLPKQIVAAQCQLVIEQQNGIELSPSTPGGLDGQLIIREKVDVLETEYSDKVMNTASPTMPRVNSLLRGLINAEANAVVSAVRV